MDTAIRKTQAPPSSTPDMQEKIREAAEGLEALFISMMFEAMRKTVPKNDLDCESPATEIYRNMLDREIADKSAHQKGFGLAEQIVAYLSRDK